MIIFIPLIFWGMTSCRDIATATDTAAIVTLVASEAIVTPLVAYPLAPEIEDLVITPIRPADIPVPETGKQLGTSPNTVLAVMHVLG